MLALTASVGVPGCAAPPATPQSSVRPRLPKIGLLRGGRRPSAEGDLLDGLRELGYVDGKNIAIEERSADGRLEMLPEMAAELVRVPVELIVTTGWLSTRAARAATSTIPIIITNSADPVESGFVADLVRPGGNVTGLTSTSPEQSGKRLELLREVLPGANHIALLWNPASAAASLSFNQTQAAARALGVQILAQEVRERTDLESVFDVAARQHVDALVPLWDYLVNTNLRSIADLALSYRLPGIYEFREFTEAGGLMSYGASQRDQYHRVAGYVDRILRGAKPGELPLERAARFELVLNLRTAQSLGLQIPPSTLAHTDEVIR